MTKKSDRSVSIKQPKNTEQHILELKSGDWRIVFCPTQSQQGLLGIHKTRYSVLFGLVQMQSPCTRNTATGQSPSLSHIMLFLINLLSCTIEQCPEGMVFVNGGSFILGEDPPQFSWQLTGRPYQVAPFCIDRYEFPNQEGEYPKNNVTFDEAKALCAQLGKYLCREPQWEYACQGAENWLYSYGSQFVESNCHTESTKGDHPFSRSGQYPKCRSPQGVFDLNGNLSEWVDSTWSQNNTTRVNWKTLRGGTIESKTHYGQDCTSRHGHHQKNWRNSDDGFRCCAEPN